MYNVSTKRRTLGSFINVHIVWVLIIWYISSIDLEVFSASRTSTKLVPLTVQDKEAGCNKKQGKLKTEKVTAVRFKNGTMSSFLSWMGALKC